MKKQKNKKISMGSLTKGAREAMMKSALNLAVIAVFLVVVFFAGKAYLYKSDYFRLKRVEIKETFLDQKSLVSIKSKILSACQGKSVFSLNLRVIAQSLQKMYPDAKNISVALVLPDKLVVGLKLRKPVALVKADKLYPVDEEGVILPIADAASLKWVPVVEGIQLRPDERKAKSITSKNLEAAIALLRNIKDFKAITDCGVKAVDVKDLGNITFSLRNEIEIRMGSQNFKERLAVLADTLKDPRLVMDRIKYIDLRFGDAVIGPR
ncbi:MAG: cell division protein FtsQ/DivIB [Candidatus Omnitrophica bacterium]|nr:cell division protein FtsQ/DivIB [Candidatus Omnitrophota bacterium]